jgi:hypothetical protein
MPRHPPPAGPPPWCCLPALSLAALLGLAAPTAASAALGERSESVAADRVRLQARAAGLADQGRYLVHELAAPTATLHEFATPDGVVFAVAWSGLAPPELEPLLGAFADDYRAARRPRGPRRGERSARVVGQRVVVETWGRPRDLHGRAWVPALLPAGVMVDELR